MNLMYVTLPLSHFMDSSKQTYPHPIFLTFIFSNASLRAKDTHLTIFSGSSGSNGFNDNLLTKEGKPGTLGMKQ